MLTIEAPTQCVVEICNVAGTVIKSYVASGVDGKVSVSDLVKGLYIVKIEHNGNVVTEKLLINKRYDYEEVGISSII